MVRLFTCLPFFLLVACGPASLNDFAGLTHYQEANAKLPPPKATENRVVFLGDSITELWPFDAYFYGEPFVNRGIGGQATVQMLARFRQDVIYLKPKVVVILAGTNDIGTRAPSASLGDVKANFESMSDLALANGIKVVLSSVLPTHDYHPSFHHLFETHPMEKIRELNTWLREYCTARGLVYLDYFSALLDETDYLRRELANDGLHPNSAGYVIMAKLAKAAVDEALQRGNFLWFRPRMEQKGVTCRETARNHLRSSDA